MKKLFGALALVITSLLAYQFVVDRMRAQLMGAAHPAGALAAVKVPRKLRSKAPQRRFEYSDATQALERSWVDEQQLVQSSTPAGDGAASDPTRSDRS